MNPLIWITFWGTLLTSSSPCFSLYSMVNTDFSDEDEMSANYTGSPRKVRVEVYYEVLCPDSRYFILHQLYKAWEKVDDIMDVQFKPYGKAQYRRNPKGAYAFECQHGPTECQGNIVHACSIKYIKDSAQLMEYIKCMMEDNYSPLERGQKCADELSINWNPIEKCARTVEGEELLAMHGDDTHSLRPKVAFIPTIVLDGSQDDQKDILKNFALELCRKYKGERPANCVEVL